MIDDFVEHALLVHPARQQAVRDGSAVVVVKTLANDTGTGQFDVSLAYRRMHQVDEKWQLNFFLGEWLRFCLQQGRATACELPFLPAG